MFLVGTQMKRVLLSYAALLLSALLASSQQIAGPKQAPANYATAAPSAPSAQQIWADLLEGNRRFVASAPKFRDLAALRNGLTKAQHPKAIVLACSDSRVAPELLFDQSLGDLFVIRSAGNVADAIGVGSIEYAVDHLGSSVLVVLGHTKCGAVTAACSGEKMPSANLQSFVDKIEPAVAKIGGPTKSDELIEKAIKQNVHQSAKDVLASSEVLRHFVQEGKLTVFEAEYQLDTGEVIRLDRDDR